MTEFFEKPADNSIKPAEFQILKFLCSSCGSTLFRLIFFIFINFFKFLKIQQIHRVRIITLYRILKQSVRRSVINSQKKRKQKPPLPHTPRRPLRGNPRAPASASLPLPACPGRAPNAQARGLWAAAPSFAGSATAPAASPPPPSLP
jgi:predicted lipid-binding transport protein (Tim44 family)